MLARVDEGSASRAAWTRGEQWYKWAPPPLQPPPGWKAHRPLWDATDERLQPHRYIRQAKPADLSASQLRGRVRASMRATRHAAERVGKASAAAQRAHAYAHSSARRADSHVLLNPSLFVHLFEPDNVF